MSVRSLACIIAIGFACTPMLHAQNSVAWKFEVGQVFEAERVASEKQVVELKGKQFKQDRHSTWYIRLEVKEKKDDDFLLTATLMKVEHKLTGAADTELVDPKLPEKMKGSTFILQVSPRGRIANMQGYDDFLNRLAEKDKARLKALRVTFPEPTLKEAFADLFGPLPGKDADWQREFVEPIPHFGALRSTAKYQHVGGKKGVERIDYAIETKYQLPKEEPMVLFRIVKGSIETEKAEGRITFDAGNKAIIHERTMRLRGTLTIEATEKKQSLEFRSENQVKVRVKLAR